MRTAPFPTLPPVFILSRLFSNSPVPVFLLSRLFAFSPACFPTLPHVFLLPCLFSYSPLPVFLLSGLFSYYPIPVFLITLVSLHCNMLRAASWGGYTQGANGCGAAGVRSLDYCTQHAHIFKTPPEALPYAQRRKLTLLGPQQACAKQRISW